MRSLACVLLLLFSTATALAQRVDPPPQEQAKQYLTVFTHSDWAQRSQERALIESLNRSPMKELVAKVHLVHYTEKDPVFASGRFPTITMDDFPVVIFGDSRGGYVFKASKLTLPTPGQPLYDAIKEAYKRDQALAQTEPVIPIPSPLPAGEDAGSTELVADDCDDGYCPPSPDFNRDPVFPNAPWNQGDQDYDSMEFLFGGDTPIRDSLGYVAWIFGAIVALIFMSIVFFFVVSFAALVIWALRR
jgi:hypothetical protein